MRFESPRSPNRSAWRSGRPSAEYKKGYLVPTASSPSAHSRRFSALSTVSTLDGFQPWGYWNLRLGAAARFPGGTMGSMIAAFSITPLGTGESVGDLVAEAVRIARASGLACETNAMFTNIEGEWDEVMSVIKECVQTLSAFAPRLSVVMKLDVRPGEPAGRLESKVASIERRLAPTTQ